MHEKRTKENIRRNRGRRGAGIEMAMLLMLVTVALSGLLTSAAMMQIDKQKDSEEQLELLEQRMRLDRIGRDFCSQRAAYELPLGVKGVITCGYGTDEFGAKKDCPGCCEGCVVCDKIYPDNTENTEDNEESEVNAAAEENEGTEDNESRPECCEECTYCTIGCTGFTEISLVVYSDSEEVVLTVELTNNQNGTYTVTEWSYGE